ncbi:MAG: metal ABC transporter ATP-binding protein [Microthrixaceae bacterium]
MNEPALRTENLTVAYGSTLALDHVDAVIPAGTSTALVGPNGSGKSTFLRAVAGLVAPLAGSIAVPARDTDGGVALVPQGTVVDPALPLSVTETVRIARYKRTGLAGRFRRADREAAESAIDRVDLTHLASRQLGELSGGQRQRALVAQGLAQGGELLLLDEPLTGLDLGSQERIWSIVAEERARGRTVIVSTHDLGDARRCDLVLLVATKLVALGTPDEVLTPAVLGEAYGSRIISLGESSMLLDDPHHHDH